MNAQESHDRGSVIFLVGVIIAMVLTAMLATWLLRKPVNTNPFDAPADPSALTPGG